jgi:GABA(A) receptor-associated protein
MSFKNKFSFDKRVLEAQRILSRYPDRIPVICEKSKNQNLPPLNKVKYLLPHDLTIGQFICFIRKQMKLDSTYALFVTIEGYIPPSLMRIGEIYKTSKYADGFLYIEYSSENTFGYGDTSH